MHEKGDLKRWLEHPFYLKKWYFFRPLHTFHAAIHSPFINLQISNDKERRVINEALPLVFELSISLFIYLYYYYMAMIICCFAFRSSCYCLLGFVDHTDWFSPCSSCYEDFVEITTRKNQRPLLEVNSVEQASTGFCFIMTLIISFVSFCLLVFIPIFPFLLLSLLDEIVLPSFCFCIFFSQLFSASGYLFFFLRYLFLERWRT